jgi:AraC-like DNA-binding protein
MDTRGCLSLPSQEGEGDAILRVGCQVWRAGEELAREQGGRSAILLVRRGSGRFVTTTGAWPLQVGDLLLRLHGQAFRLQATRHLELQMVAFTGDALRALLRPCCPAGPVVVRPEGRSRVLEQLQQLHRLLLDDGPLAEDIALHLLRALILGIRADGERQRRQGRAEGHYWACRAVAREHFQELTSVADWAAACGFSPTYLARLFGRFGDCTPLAFLQRQQVLEAEQLLAEGHAVGEVAVLVGFSDPFRFSKVFKRLTGRPPREVKGQPSRR